MHVLYRERRLCDLDCRRTILILNPDACERRPWKPHQHVCTCVRLPLRPLTKRGAQARHNEVGMAGGLAVAAHQQLLRMQQAGLAPGHLPSLQDLQAMQARPRPA